MSIDNLLANLHKVKSTGQGRWVACCPAHKDKTPSLAIRLVDDGRILLKCFGCGASAHEIVSSIGMDIEDLFPPRETTGKPLSRPFPAADILRCLNFELNIVMLAAQQVMQGEPINVVDYERLKKAYTRIGEGVKHAGL